MKKADLSAAAQSQRPTEAKAKPGTKRSRQSRRSSGKPTADASATGKPETGAPGRGGRSARGKAKTQPTINVIPRILARPQEPNTPRSTEREQPPAVPKAANKREPETPSQSLRKPAPTDSPLGVADGGGAVADKYLQQLERPPRHGRMSLLTSSGKLLDSALRRHLGTLQCRSCVGVLGRAGAGKSTVMSYVAGTRDFVFPAAKAGGSVTTNGMDFWTTPSRIVLLDTPPVLSLGAADKWTRRSETMSKLSCARLRDLQLASFLLQICDTLLVVVRTDTGGESAGRRGQQPGRRRASSMCVDQAVIKLLKAACLAVPVIPGLSMTTKGHETRPCRLHIVINGPADMSKQRISDIYAASTGLPVSLVTVLPAIGSEKDRAMFEDIYDRWTPGGPSSVPLYSTDLFAKPAQGIEKTSLIATGDILGANLSFDECIEELRFAVLDRGGQGERGWRVDESKGAWMAACLKAWDSIRRSDVLVQSATAKDEDLDRMDS